MATFAPGELIRPNHRQVTYADVGQPHGLDEEFVVQTVAGDDWAWVRWAGPAGNPRGRWQVTALACAHCRTVTTRRCCGPPWCDLHRHQHRAIEHAPPDGGRYQAAIAAPELDRWSEPPAPIPGLRYPTTPVNALSHPARGDGLRLVEHVRLTTMLTPDADPIGDALRPLAGRVGLLPRPRRAAQLAADILCRCTRAAMIESLGDPTTAAWMRAQPPVPALPAVSALTEQVRFLDLGRFGDFGLQPITGPGEMAANDALAELALLDPPYRLSRADAYEVFSHALTLPDGPETVGRAVARAQRDAVVIIVAELANASA